MSLFKKNKNRNKVENPYYSLGFLEQTMIVDHHIFQYCAKLKPNKSLVNVKWTSAACEGEVQAHPSHPPPYGPEFLELY